MGILGAVVFAFCMSEGVARVGGSCSVSRVGNGQERWLAFCSVVYRLALSWYCFYKVQTSVQTVRTVMVLPMTRQV